MREGMKTEKKYKKYIIASAAIVLVFCSMIAISFLLRRANESYTHSSYPLLYVSEIRTAAEKYDVDIALICGIIKTESNFDPDAESDAGAYGLMQLTEDTFIWMQTFYREGNDYTFSDLSDPALNIDYGTQVISVLLEMYKDEDTAVCAYNGGLGNVDEWLADPQYSDDGIHLKTVPFPETENYRHLVAQNKSIYRQLYFS